MVALQLCGPGAPLGAAVAVDPLGRMDKHILIPGNSSPGVNLGHTRPKLQLVPGLTAGLGLGLATVEEKPPWLQRSCIIS